ncbi:MAG: hypothetical protein ABW104_07040 [Candidatus Thiodiazotropha sp. 6PLUC2]
MQQLSNATFSIRRLNPFNGLLQVYQQDSARALSANGVVWEIQVLSETPQGLWANTPLGEGQYFTFGLWSEANGLEQVPVNPLFDIRSMIEASDTLISGLQPVLPQLPFPMADHYELWLMDEESGEPVALLQSCRAESEIQLHNMEQKWIAAAKGDFSFISPHLRQRGVPSHDGYNPRVHASIVEAEVRGRAGFPPQTAWFYNDPDTGMMHHIGDSTTTVRFPELPLTESGYDAENAPLIADYITWKAPQLLMLPNLSRETRERLERLAVDQAEQIDRLWTLYPEIHNKDLLKRARVEARIRKANRN